MAYANYIKRHETKTRLFPAIVAMTGLFGSGVLMFYYEFTENPTQLVYILAMYLVLFIGAFVYARMKKKQLSED